MMEQAEQSPEYKVLHGWLARAFMLGLKHERRLIPSDVALCMVIGPNWKEQRDRLMYQILLERLPDCLVELERQKAYWGRR